MNVLAIDPGPSMSAFVLYDADISLIKDHGKLPNQEMLNWIRHERCSHNPRYTKFVIEMIASYGRPVGAEVFETCVMIGRMIECARGEYDLVYRKDVKLHICNHPRANDAAIRQALIDRWGGKQESIGNKSNQGPLYGIKGDVWQALALAVTYAETRMEKVAA